MTSEKSSLIATIDDFFTQAGLARVDVPILQPAEPFLDSVGEDLRRRIFITENEHGEQLCLRPEFTIPVCLSHIKEGHTLPYRYAYLGEVFRQCRADQSSFYQAGIEDLGEPDEVKADVRSLKDALDLVKFIKPRQEFQILIGDHGLFDTLLSQLGLAIGWQRRLRACFGNEARLRNVLDNLSNTGLSLELPLDITKVLEAADEQHLINLIEAQFYEKGLPLHASRGATEIAQRLREKVDDMCKPLELGQRQKMEEFLSIHVPLSRAVVTIRDFAHNAHLDLGKALKKFEERIQLMSTYHLDIATIDYDGTFGRSLDYYTGFVYEIRHDEQILVGGGRYDHLLHLLGAHLPIPAVGFSLWLDRLERLSSKRELLLARGG